MDTKHIKRLNAEAQREQMRNGVILRATTFTDRKKEAARKACRGRQTVD